MAWNPSKMLFFDELFLKDGQIRHECSFHTRLRMPGGFAKNSKCFWNWMQECHVGFERFLSQNSLTIALSLPSKMDWNPSKKLFWMRFFKKKSQIKHECVSHTCFWSWTQACQVGFERFSSQNSLTTDFSLPSKMIWNRSKMLFFLMNFFKNMAIIVFLINIYKKLPNKAWVRC